MNTALFGGTFDPVHRGHLKVARAAADKFKLKEVWFVPADIPPHKQRAPITSFYHRYAMLSVALVSENDFIPSLVEAPDPDAGRDRKPSYSIETVRRVRASLGKSDHLYFLIGMDAFQDIGTWYQPEALLRECEFIVAARPGYSLADVASALPEQLRPKAAVTRLFRKQEIDGPLVLAGATLHLLPETHENISATEIRAAVARGGALKRLVPDTVAEYIHKTHLYRCHATKGKAAGGKDLTHEEK